MNHIHHGTAEDMQAIEDGSVHLIVTSPPYNVGMAYEDKLPFVEFRKFLQRVWKECHRVLVDGGRIAINVGNTGRRPYIPLAAYITVDMLNMGYLMRGDIIWNKSASAHKKTSWGSWMSASNPYLRDLHEYIIVFGKSSLGRKDKGESTMSRDDFLVYTESVWNMHTASAKHVGHPAPFPVELPYRLINFYSYRGDVILDPFMGSGTTAIAAEELDRLWIGYACNKSYIELANCRIEKSRIKQLSLL